MKYLSSLLLLCALFMTPGLQGQVRIDGDFAFQNDPAKKYSLFLPSSYDSTAPNKMMVALHPWNTSRWDAKSWCDTLVDFAETNGLILMCPDGGADGQVDDAIDTAFTTVLMDSMTHWYNIDSEGTFCMGFSWGARTTYTYGFNNPEKFCGYLPVGAAISGTTTVTPTLIGQVRGKPVYIVHGGNDSPNSRYWPVVNALPDSGVVLNNILMPGIGHTIDFPNRNQILSTAFAWLDSVCQVSPPVAVDPMVDVTVNIHPNPVAVNRLLRLEVPGGENSVWDIEIYDLKGKRILTSRMAPVQAGARVLEWDSREPGIYLLRVAVDGQQFVRKVSVY